MVVFGYRFVYGASLLFSARDWEECVPNQKNNMSSFRNPMIKAYPPWNLELAARLKLLMVGTSQTTTCDVWNPANSGIFTISAGAGFLPSTVGMVKSTESEVDKVLGGLPLVRKTIRFSQILWYWIVQPPPAEEYYSLLLCFKFANKEFIFDLMSFRKCSVAIIPPSARTFWGNSPEVGRWSL